MPSSSTFQGATLLISVLLQKVPFPDEQSFHSFFMEIKSFCSGARKPMYSGLYLAWPCMRSCDVKSYAHCPTCCKLTQLTAFYGMDLNMAHQEDSTVATSGSRCQTMCVSICHLLSHCYLFLWSPTPIYFLSSDNCDYSFRLSNDNCFAPSPRRPDREYKRMVLELTHGLFIT
jgi:hypothetical protein